MLNHWGVEGFGTLLVSCGTFAVAGNNLFVSFRTSKTKLCGGGSTVRVLVSEVWSLFTKGGWVFMFVHKGHI